MANLQDLATLAAVQELGTAVKADITRVEGKIPSAVSALANDKGYATTEEVNAAVSSQIGRVYKAGGSKLFSELPEAGAETLGYVYNVKDEFTITENFVEYEAGKEKKFPAGTDVGVVQEDGGAYKYNIFVGFIDTSTFVPKENGKGLSTTDYSADDKSKLDGIAAGATKVEKSEVEGNIKINDVETHIVSIASAQDVSEVIKAIFPGTT